LKLLIDKFIGMRPIVDSKLLPRNVAVTATNINTDSGALVPLKGNTNVWTPTKTGTILSIYRYNSSFWFHWPLDVNVLRGPVPDDTLLRTYFTGDGLPQVTDSSIATGGGTDYPTAAYTLGVPAPANAPTVTLAGSSSDTTEDEDRSYVYTFVSGWGEEGAPSPPSDVLTGHPTSQTWDLSAMDGVPTGNYNITQKRIYRTKTTADGTTYYLVGTVDIATTIYSDTTTIVAATATLQSEDYDMPPSGLIGVVSMPGGVIAGFAGNRICFSEPYQPHAYPTGYRLTVSETIVGLGVFGNSLLVLTEDHPYIVSGDDPASMSIQRLEINQSCVSKRGIVDLGEAIAWPSPDGLMVTSMDGTRNITEKILSRAQWQAYNPSELLGAVHDGKYYGFNSTSGFVLDLRNKAIIDLDFTATAAWNDSLTDTLYLVVSGEIVSYGTGADKEFTWESPPMRTPKKTNLGCMQVDAEDYPLTASLYAEGVQKASVLVVDDNTVLLPGGYMARDFQVKLVGSVTVNSVTLARRLSDLR